MASAITAEQAHQLIAQLAEQNQLLKDRAALAAAPGAHSAAAASATQHRTKIPAASNFSGTASTLDGWLREMRQQFDWYKYIADAEQVAMAAAQLRGNALDWWAAQLKPAEQAALRLSFAAFEQALRARFQPINSAKMARHALDTLRQGAKQPVHDYTSSFRRLLTPLPDMSEADRVHCYTRGLRPALQLRLVENDPATLDAAISLATRLGSLSQFAASSAPAGQSYGHGDGNAMDLSNIEGLEQTDGGDDDAAAPVTRGELQKMQRQLLNAMQQHRSGNGAGNRDGKRAPFGRGSRGPPRVPGLSPQQVRERMDAGLCFLCGEAGHRKYDCPENKQSTN
jgi:hypothetical protein